jgi:RNA-binding protein YlmH
MAEEVLGIGSKAYHPNNIACIVLRKIRRNMEEKTSSMRVSQVVSAYLTLSRQQDWTLVKDYPKVAIKYLLSVVKPAQLKEVCENDLLLGQL